LTPILTSPPNADPPNNIKANNPVFVSLLIIIVVPPSFISDSRLR
jgi:hypothetical protein